MALSTVEQVLAIRIQKLVGLFPDLDVTVTNEGTLSIVIFDGTDVLFHDGSFTSCIYALSEIPCYNKAESFSIQSRNLLAACKEYDTAAHVAVKTMAFKQASFDFA